MRYRKLANPGQDVRLLEVLPARRLEDAIIYRLVTMSLDKLESEIFGLSSLLGDPEVIETVYIDGRAVSITAHQAEGLRSMRTAFSSTSTQQRRSWPSSGPRLQGFKLGLPQRLRHLLRIPEPGLSVWLDSICVDTTDEAETAQLKYTMKKVYRTAKIVAGWLGPAIVTTTAGLSVFTSIDEAMPQFWGDPGDKELHPENYAPTHKCFEKLRPLWADGDDGMAAFMLPHWVGGNDFMHRSYFQRQWILQELFMANIFPSAYRAAIAELPLGTVYELLEEMMRRKQRLMSIANIEEEYDAVFPYCGAEREIVVGVERTQLKWSQK